MGARKKIQVKATRIITTNTVIYSAWEPSGLMGKHGTITSDGNGGWLGQVGTKRPPERFMDLPSMSDERYEKVTEHYKREKARAIAAILGAHPWLLNSDKYENIKIDHSMGEIRIDDASKIYIRSEDRTLLDKVTEESR